MKLVLYSGGQTPLNHRLHRRLAELVGDKPSKSLTYLPFCDDGASLFYGRAIRRYQRFGFDRFRTVSVDTSLREHELEDALSSDVIYLAGGNTFYFLHHLKKSGMLPRLRAFAARGGVLAGLSAGALILTPHIALAGYPTFNADENEVGMTDLSALGLTPFEFYPHYMGTPREERALKAYSESSSHPVYAVPDGAGLVYCNDVLEIFGRVVRYHHGHRLDMMPR